MTDEDGQSPIPTSQSYSDFTRASENDHVVKALPNYLTNQSVKGDIHDIMIDTNEENNETGAGCDSDCEADEINNIDNELHLARLFKLVSIAEQDSNEDDGAQGRWDGHGVRRLRKAFKVVTHYKHGGTVVQANGSETKDLKARTGAATTAVTARNAR